MGKHRRRQADTRIKLVKTAAAGRDATAMPASGCYSEGPQAARPHPART